MRAPALPTISHAQRRRRLAHRHLLVASQRTDRVDRIADGLIALHASDPASVYLAAMVRMQQPSVERVRQTFVKQRSLLRHHAMRRTIWAMTPRIAQLAHGAATAKLVESERRRTLDALARNGSVADPEGWLEQASEQIVDLLSEQAPLSAREIGRQLPELMLPLQFGTGKFSAKLNAHTKVLQGGAFRGRFVRTEATGGWVSGEYRWTVAQRWLDREIAVLTEREAAPNLLRCWLARFGPATEEDIRWWFGWTASLTRAALGAAEVEAVQLEDGNSAWVLAGDTEFDEDGEPWVRLLPGLDPTTMGWKERDWYLNPAWTSRLFDRFGNAGPTIWADGQVVGGWIQRPDTTIVFTLCRPLKRQQLRLLDDAIAQLREAVGEVVVKPRFPAPLQKELLCG